MRRKPLAWITGVVGVLVVCVVLAWSGSAFLGLGLVPGSWFPRSRSADDPSRHGEPGPPVELARGQHGDRHWRLVGYTSERKSCVEAHVNEVLDSAQCGFREFAGQPGYGPSTSDLGGGSYLTFGPVPSSAATIVVRFDDGVWRRIPARRSPRSPLSFFGVTTEHRQQPVAAEVRLYDAQGREIHV